MTTKRETKEVMIEFMDVLGFYGVVFATTKQKALRSSFKTTTAANLAIFNNNRDPKRIYNLKVIE